MPKSVGSFAHAVVAGEPPVPRGDSGAAPTVSVVMPTIDWGGCFPVCAGAAIGLVAAARGRAAEMIVVFDGPECPIPAWLENAGVRVLFTGCRRGPAGARNLAASHSRGDVILFLDGDVEVSADALRVVEHRFRENPDLVAMFGAYDDSPASPGVVAGFRNLLHHHTHVSHPGPAMTFWSGCGAIRAAAFADLGGFDESYLRPSIEDVELGMRVADSGGRIDLVPELLCKHHKEWTLGSMVRTDIFQRAVPWSRLILERATMPATLNLDWRGRSSGAASASAIGLLAVAITAAPFLPRVASAAIVLATLLFAAVIVANFGFYRLCFRRRGLGFTLASVFLHVCYFAYSTITFGVMLAAHACAAPWSAGDPAPAPDES